MRENITSILLGSTGSIVAVMQNGGFLKVVVYSFVGGVLGAAGKVLFQHINNKIKAVLARRKAKKSRIIMLNQNQENL